MANMMLYNAFLSVNGVDLSAHVRSVNLKYDANMLDDTMMGDSTKSNKAGLKNWQIDVEFEQDYAAAQVDATLFPLIGAAAFAIILRPDSGARGATNPEFTGNAVLENYTPLGGAVGDLLMAPITLRCAGTLSRSVTP